MRQIHMLIILAGLLVAGCTDDATKEEQSEPQAAKETDDPVTRLMTAFIEAKRGDVIEVPAGTWSIGRSLTLNTNNVTVRGAGMDKTTLSFRDQVAGAEGILVNASDFTIEDLAIVDTRGDALKINEGKNIIVRRVRTEWTGGPDVENGSYGIYPVQTENTLIEESVAIGASDAGIYVGQSRNVIVRNNRAEFNVAGIEIENTVGADVYGNWAISNTGGILVFSMPDLPMAGHSTRVYKNHIESNNTENFAPKGTAVAGVPAGTGVLINSNDKVEIFDNRIADNATANILISSLYSSSLQEREQAPNFDPYPEGIYIYANDIIGGGTRPDKEELEQLRLALYGEEGSLPGVVWDGLVDPEKMVDGRLPDNLRICIEGDVTVVNVDAANEYRNPVTDISTFRCQLEKLPPVTLALPSD